MEESWTKYKNPTQRKTGENAPFTTKLHLAKGEDEGDEDHDPVHL